MEAVARDRDREEVVGAGWRSSDRDEEVAAPEARGKRLEVADIGPDDREPTTGRGFGAFSTYTVGFAPTVAARARFRDAPSLVDSDEGRRASVGRRPHRDPRACERAAESARHQVRGRRARTLADPAPGRC